MAFTAQALALTGAVCSAIATIAFRQGLRYANTYSGFWINLTVGLICVWVATLLTVPASAMHAKALPFFIGSGLLGTVAGRFFRFKGIEKVGAPVAAAVNNLNPFISTGLAILLLGERVTLPIFLGTCVIVLGTILLSMSGRYVGFRPVHLFYPFLSACCFGSVAIIRKLGLSHAPPMFGYAINVTTAANGPTINPSTPNDLCNPSGGALAEAGGDAGGAIILKKANADFCADFAVNTGLINKTE